MSYESRAMVVISYEAVNTKPTSTAILATINLSCIEQEIRSVFDKEVDFRIYDIVNGDDFYPYNEDKYGDKLTYCTIDELYEVLKGMHSENRRVDILKRTIEAIKLGYFEHEQIYVVHYGY